MTPHRPCPSSVRPLPLIALAALLLHAGVPASDAQLYWDTNGATPGSGNAGGEWNSGTLWSTDPAGGVATQLWTDGNQAVFSAGSDGVGLREISVSGTVAPNGILVKDGIVSFTSGTINSTAVVQANNNATFRINGASVTGSLFEAGRNSFGTIDMVSGSLTGNAIDVGNPSNVGGAVVQSGGTINLDGVGRPANVGLRLGHWGSNVASTYTMTGGTLNVTATGGMHVGWDGPGQFTVNGGGAAINTTLLSIGSPAGTGGSTLNLQDGTITARYVDLGVRGADRPGTINQTGGSLIVQPDGGPGTPELRIGHWPGTSSGTYNLTGGTLDTTAAITRIGWDGRGVLAIGGDASFNGGNIEVVQGSLLSLGGDATIDAGSIKLVQDSFLTINGGDSAFFTDIALGGAIGGRSGTGTLEMNGGTLETVRLSVGDSAGGHAGFVNQTGGDFIVGGQFLLGHWGSNTSVYNMSGGTLTLTGTPAGGGEQVGGIYIGVDGSGIFNHSDGVVSTSFLWLDNRGQTTGPHEYNLTGGELILTSGIGMGTSNPGNPDLQVNLGGGTITAGASTQITVAATLTGDGGNTTFNTAGNTLTVPATLSGPGGMTVAGGGSMFMTSPTSYSGGTVIDGATLRLTGYGGSTGAGAGNLDYTIQNGGRLELASGFFAGNPFGSQTIDVLIASGGTMEIVSPHALGGSNLNGGSWRTVEIEDGGTLTLTREQYVTGGTLDGNGRLVMTGGLIDGPDELRATSQAGGAILTVLPNATPSEMAARLSAVFGGWTLDVREDAQLNVTGTIVGANANGLTVTGGGTARLSGTNTYTGTTTIDNGTLALANGSGKLYQTGGFFGVQNQNYIIVNTGGTFRTWDWSYGDDFALSQLRNNYGQILLNGGTIELDDTFSSPRAFTVGANGGTLEVTAGNTYTKLAGTTAGQNIIRFEAASTLTLGGAGNGIIQDSLGAYGNTGFSIAKVGTGTWTLAGANTYTGATDVLAGTLLIDGDHSAATGDVTVQSGATLGGIGVIGGATVINDGAVLAPGNSAGTLTFNQDLALAPGSTFDVDVLFGGTDTDLVVMAPQTILSVDGATLAGTWDGSDANIFRGTYSADTMFWVVDHRGTAPIDGRFENTTPAPGFAGLVGGVTPYLTTIDDQLFAVFYESQFEEFSQAGLTGGNDLLLMSIPEPSRALLLALAAGSLLLRRRR